MLNCKICGKEKEEKYKRNSYCKNCVVQKTKEWRLKNPGYSKKEWEVSKKRTIRNKFCIVCKNEKEEKWMHTSYCSKCATEKSKIWSLKNKDRVEKSLKKRRELKQSTICKECGIMFLRKRGECVCSLKCKLLNEKIINENGCWISPILNGKGYGNICFRGLKSKLAHRISYSEFKGEIPEQMHICHKCDVPACYNPDHLFLGTPKDNVHDGIKKGRIKHLGAKGRSCIFTNLTEFQVEEIRKLYTEGFSCKRLSIIFNCTKEYISKIIRKKVRNIF